MEAKVKDTAPTARDMEKVGLKLLDTAHFIRDKVQGVYLSRSKGETMEQRVQGVKEFKLKDGDVVGCVYPKCGTHWLIRILVHLVHKTAKLDLGVTFDYFFLDCQRLDLLCNLDPPRVFCTHYPFDLLPESVKDGRTKLVHMYRNPKASFISSAHMITNIKETKRGIGVLPDLEDVEFEKHAESYIQDDGGTIDWYVGWFHHMMTVIKFKEDNPHVPIFHLAYEDLLQDTAGCLRSLSDFLGLDVSDALCSDIADAVSFKRQKEEEEKACPKESLTHSAHIYRKGTADDWKNYLTVAHNEKFDAKLREYAHLSPMFDRYITPHV